MYMCMHVSVCGYVHMGKGAPGHQRYWIPLELELQVTVVTCPEWVLETWVLCERT